MEDLIRKATESAMKKELPHFNVGDTVRVVSRIIEGGNERTHTFEGVVISRSGKGISETFTLRKLSYGIGVERIFPLHSPLVQEITVLKTGKVRRAKLYYLRKKVGKATKVKEKRPDELQ